MIRPVGLAPTQLYGDNPTSTIHPGSPDYWIIERYGNYQPDGHAGEDYPCKAGTPVRAVADGTVLHIGRLGGTYADNPWWIAPGFAGYVAVIDHGAFIGIYGHCMDGSGKVKAGQRVTEGQVFVLSGNTGASTGDHLHFEILPDGYVLNSRMYGRVNPETLFTGSLSHAGATITPLEDDVANTPNELQEAVQTVLRDNPLVMGGRSVAAGVNQALLGIDVVNENIAQLKVFVAQQFAPTADVRDESSTYYLKGEEKPEVYALDVATGKLRHVLSAEFDVVTAIGIFKTVPQAKVDALLGAAK